MNKTNYSDIQDLIKQVLNKFRSDFRGQKFMPKVLFPVRDLKIIYLKVKGIQNYLEDLPINEFPNSVSFRRILVDLRKEELAAKQSIFNDQVQFLQFIAKAMQYIRQFLEALKKHEVYNLV